MELGRRTLLAFLMYGVADMALANAPSRSERPRPRPFETAHPNVRSGESIVQSAKLGGRVGYAVADARTGKILEQRGGGEKHPPASVAKAVTAMYALDQLGPGHRFRTRLIATGPVRNGVVEGDLALVGSGDPTLDTDALFEMASELKAKNIRAIRGKLLVHGGGLGRVKTIDAGQPEYVGYSPAVSGLNLNFNRIYLEWKRTSSGYSVTMDARSERLRPEVSFARISLADRKSPVFTYEGTDTRETWTVARGALGKGGGRWLPVRNPEIYAGDVLQTLARSHGIALPAPKLVRNAPKGTTLVDHVSDDLTTICRSMLRYSTNITAEALGLRASGARSLKQSGLAMSQWLAIKKGSGSARFIDHSGLGDRSRVTPVDMVRALQISGPQGTLRPILKQVPIRDDKGRPIQNGKVQVVAKTGTLNFVSSLAGFIRTADGRDLIFAIFTSDMSRRSKLSRAQRERPRGARSWNGRSKTLQQRLLKRWAKLYA